jgi:hypothetical protein
MWLAISRWQKAAKNPKNTIVYSRRCCALALPRWKSRAKLVAVGDSWRTPTGWVPPPPGLAAGDSSQTMVTDCHPGADTSTTPLTCAGDGASTVWAKTTWPRTALTPPVASGVKEKVIVRDHKRPRSPDATASPQRAKRPPRWRCYTPGPEM